MSHEVPDPKTDPMGFVLALKKGAEQGRAVAAARPRLKEVGAHLLALEREMADALWGGVGSERHAQHPLVPLPDAPGNIVGTPRLNPKGSLTFEVADGFLTATRDHLGGLGSLLAVDGPRRSILVLARTLLDVSVHAAFLLEPAVDDRTRTQRTFNLTMEAIRQEIADGGTSNGDLRDRQMELRKAATADGFSFAERRNKGGNEVCDMNMLTPRTEPRQIREAILGEGSESAWRDLSSVTHGQERTVLRFVLGLGSLDPGPHSDSMATAWLAFAVEAACIAAERAATFYGTVRGRGFNDRVIGAVRQVIFMAAGLGDDIVRRQLGFEGQ